MTNIHPTAIIDPHAEVDDGVTIGPYTVVEGNVRIGRGSIIGAHVYLAAGVQLGEQCRVFHSAVLGTVPQDLKFKGEPTALIVGDRTTIREFATLNRGTLERGRTTVGSDCLLMAYVHVAHDCAIGDHCILANAVNLAGHVVIEDWASLGGMVPVHQFVRIGQHSFVGGGYRVSKDVPPYILAMSEPLRFAGLNSIGLRRRGFSEAALRALKRAYKLIYKSHLNVSQAVQQIRAGEEITPEVGQVLDFIARSDRGIIG